MSLLTSVNFVQEATMLFIAVLAAQPLFTVTLAHLIYFIIAILLGIIAETIIGWRLPYGILGAVLCAFIGILIAIILPFRIGGEVIIFGEPIALTQAIIGGAILLTIWHLVTYRHWRHRHRYYRGYRYREYGERRD
ncbi:hypothetical protein [Thermogemmatispora sp.]|nr:hypothetical protein [Thermogemmatispora sp.]MBX5448994.1 transglycosylase [Thermogemmatispora sp.]